MASFDDRIKEQAELASFYSNSGAHHSAARVLTELAEEANAHAKRNTALIAEGKGDPKSVKLMDRANALATGDRATIEASTGYREEDFS